MPKITKLELGDHFGKHGFFFCGLCGKLLFEGLKNKKGMWANVGVFGKIPVREWGRRERWGVHTLGNESCALDLVFEGAKSY